MVYDERVEAKTLTVNFGRSFNIRRHPDMSRDSYMFIGPYSDSPPIEISYGDKRNIETAFEDFKRNYMRGTGPSSYDRTEFTFLLEIGRPTHSFSMQMIDLGAVSKPNIVKLQEPKLNKILLLL